MAIETLEFAIFVSVTKHSSFARAAEEFELTPSAVSRIVSRLEDRLGTRLLQRTTRRLSLTEAGLLFHRRALRLLADMSEIESEMSSMTQQPRGLLRLNAPVVFGRLHVVPFLGELRRRFPDIAVELTLTDQFVDVVDSGVDLAIRIGGLADSRLIARRLCTNRRWIVASPAYLARKGMPRQLSDLTGHDCLVYTGISRPHDWRLSGADGSVSVAVQGTMTSNNVEALLEAAKDGHGIALGATFSAHEALKSGSLVRVLPEFEFEPTAIFAVYASNRQLSRKVRAVIDLLASTFNDPPPWDRLLP
ncbi:LysR family transcriptional regulator [Bradyrhizobium sp. U87765 SZCCT0131]|uniref:LysR family transcriptional regulator n=1 Tax=unclassified Bradyrhizobium TaxID=2631580 RepID=UPI001BA6798E|nr:MULTISPECIES: LysR family transcriptional regulator [unclassified Bradyrhizobium]MBR1221140.1 LysR family transcriptional regulator [Bradyrhizobium sp. U87765 SZCCT0131]MBR1260039.1 LysR family transcriptional regulator [Bradyrhizobium sp. U87765 SZCCT0134]MBR1307712.1 LysR family transcriptional regulator [Bradyrhizobium sp. U87765 SZCCT0110]MBR1321666.1 LysR family transcriptional regulator [Bradyrhizobium sp. U87765 SZCCT0109]MBR1349978.1 LysR family transcriptional regulator [Bradyrhizo